jgi:hypothetical protein
MSLDPWRSIRPANSSLMPGRSCSEPRRRTQCSALPTPMLITPNVLWQGAIASDGTGPQRSCFVRLNVDGTAHCQCPAYYFRGVLTRNALYRCKHIQRAMAALAPS